MPDPARCGLHKLLVAAERGPRRVKYNTDTLPALSLIDWHLERAPTLLIDAWMDLVGRGPGWRKRALQSLKAAPSEQRDVVLKFSRP